MTVVPLGLVTVPASGTDQPFTLTAAQLSKLPPSRQVSGIDVWANPSSAGIVSVRSGGLTLAALPVPSGGNVARWTSSECGRIDPTSFALAAAVSGDGAFVTL